MAQVTAALVQELRKRTGVGMSKCKEALDQSQGDLEAAIDFLRKAGIASAVKKESRETKEGLIGHAENDKAVSLVEISAETDFVTQNHVFQDFLKEMACEIASSQPSSLEGFMGQKFSKDASLTLDEYRATVVQSVGENLVVKRLLTLPKGSASSLGVYSHMKGKIAVVVELEGAVGQEDFARDLAMHIAAESPQYLCPAEVPAEVKAHEADIAQAQLASQLQGKPAEMIQKIINGKLQSFYDQTCLVCQKYVKDPQVTVEQLVANRAKTLGQPLAIKRFIRWQAGE